ncbi:MAG: HAEPLYID family protein [Spirosomataceae bacterium]
MKFVKLYFFVFFLSVFSPAHVFAQQQMVLDSAQIERKTRDSVYIELVEGGKKLPDKVLHAEPLFIDLIRDLGARKGEKEWNVGLGLTDNTNFDRYQALIEYEFAPINRLGIEIELPFSLYDPVRSFVSNQEIPSSKLEGLKLAAQYTFLVSDKYNTSLAIGYLHEFAMPAFVNYRKESLYQGNVFSPFFVGAKRWGTNFHTLVYTGPIVERSRFTGEQQALWQVNSNFHYMIPGTRNFIGFEVNKEIKSGDFDMTLRPQMRVSVADNLIVGIVTGIPVQREMQRFSSFIRLIYEPGHRNH